MTYLHYPSTLGINSKMKNKIPIIYRYIICRELVLVHVLVLSSINCFDEINCFISINCSESQLSRCFLASFRSGACSQRARWGAVLAEIFTECKPTGGNGTATITGVGLNAAMVVCITGTGITQDVYLM